MSTKNKIPRDSFTTLDRTFYSVNCFEENEPKFQTANICRLFLESSYTQQHIIDQYREILEELESYTFLILERNFQKEELFNYSEKIVSAVQRSINNVPAIIFTKFAQSKSSKFASFELGEKFKLVKKIFETLEYSSQSKYPIYEEIKIKYFLRRDIISQLLSHLFSESQKKSLTSRDKPAKDFVWDFFYRHYKFFDISRKLGREILELFFGEMYVKKDFSKSIERGGVYMGLKKLYPGETVKVRFKGSAGETVFGDWAGGNLVYGIIFYNNRDVYSGHCTGLIREGSGCLERASGEVLDGYFRNGEFQKGVQKNSSGLEIVDLPWGREGIRIFSETDFKKPVLNKDIQNRKESVLGATIDGIYEGSFKNNQRNGYGVMFYTDGSLYKGNWIADLREGYGVFYGVDGSHYRGEWLTDKRHGQGFMKFSSLDTYQGNWKDGRTHGKGQMRGADDVVQDGKWIQNEFVANDKVEDKFQRKGTLRKSQMVKKRKKKSVLNI